MVSSRRFMAALIVVVTVGTLGACGNSGAGSPAATTTETATTESSTQQSSTPSPSTDAEFIAVIRQNVPYAENYSDDVIVQERGYICDQNSRGATRDEIAQNMKQDTYMTYREIYTFIDLSIQFCQ